MEQVCEECLDVIVSYLDVEALSRLGLSSTSLRAFCFSPRYWTQVDFSIVPNDEVTTGTIELLWERATKLKILNIQGCKKVSLVDLVPLVFKFKLLELIKHDEENRLLDETVAINRMLNNAEKLLRPEFTEGDIIAQYDNAVRQARALLLDALYVVVANKRDTKHVLPKEAHFSNIDHSQETLGLVMNKLSETEKMTQPPVKLWRNSMTGSKPVKGASFVKDPRTQKIYLAFGLQGEIVIWDLETRSQLKTFHYIDSISTPTKKNVKKERNFSNVFLFKHTDRVLLLGGASEGAVCWDYDTQQILYENYLPSKLSGSGDKKKYFASSWGLTEKGEGFVIHPSGAFLFNLGTGEFANLQLKDPERNRLTRSTYSSKNNGLILRYTKLAVEIVSMFTEEVTVVATLAPPRVIEGRDKFGTKFIDWFDDRIFALKHGADVVIYEKGSGDQYKFVSKIMSNHVFDLRFLSAELILIDSKDIYDVRTGALELSLGIGAGDNKIFYSSDLNLVARVQHVGLVALYDFKTKQKIGPEACVTPVCAISKVDDDTILLHGNYSTFASFVNYHGLNYAKVSIRGGKFEVIETVETPLQILDVSADGKYALAQDQHYTWDDRYNVEFVVFELATKNVLFKRKFLSDSVDGTATWYVSPVGKFMPQHPEQVLLAHPASGFHIFDVKSGEVLRAFSSENFGGMKDHIAISADERYVAYKTVSNNLHFVSVVDMHEDKSISISGHTNTADCLAFNPFNPKQLAIAGCGIRVFNLPSEQPTFVTRYLDGLVQTMRESEEIASVKSSPDGKYLAVLDLPSRRPWGLEIANTLVRVYETTNFTMISSFDTGGIARALHWTDNERAVIVLLNGEITSLKLVVKEYEKLFDYLVKPVCLQKS